MNWRYGRFLVSWCLRYIFVFHNPVTLLDATPFKQHTYSSQLQSINHKSIWLVNLWGMSETQKKKQWENKKKEQAERRRMAKALLELCGIKNENAWIRMADKKTQNNGNVKRKSITRNKTSRLSWMVVVVASFFFRYTKEVFFYADSLFSLFIV